MGLFDGGQVEVKEGGIVEVLVRAFDIFGDKEEKVGV